MTTTAVITKATVTFAGTTAGAITATGTAG